MKFLIIFATILGFSIITVKCAINPLDVIKKCISDGDCKHHDEFCDHTGINPFGNCRKGYEVGTKCTFDRHCMSKHCHLMKCVNRKLVKDGPCSKDQHNECLESQYCAKDTTYKCKDRVSSGWCSQHSQCLSNKCCWFFRCKQPNKDSDKKESNKL